MMMLVVVIVVASSNILVMNRIANTVAVVWSMLG